MEHRRRVLDEIKTPLREHFTFRIAPEMMDVVEEFYLSLIRNRLLWYVGLYLLVILIGFQFSRGLLGFGCAVALFGVIRLVIMFIGTKKNVKDAKERYRTTVFTYALYEDCLGVQVSSDRGFEEFIVGLDEIKKIRQLDGIIILEIRKKLYVIDRQVLTDDSYFVKRAV